VSIESISVAQSFARKLHKIFIFIQHSEPQPIFERDVEEITFIVCVLRVLLFFTAARLSEQKRKPSSYKKQNCTAKIT
jgi:hypothetical protein